MTPASRKRLSEAMKKRWAAKRAAEASSRPALKRSDAGKNAPLRNGGTLASAANAN